MSAQGLLRGLGSVVRKAGQALDSLGTAVQGKYGYKEGGAPLAECSQQQDCPCNPTSQSRCHDSQLSLNTMSLSIAFGTVGLELQLTTHSV